VKGLVGPPPSHKVPPYWGSSSKPMFLRVYEAGQSQSLPNFDRIYIKSFTTRSQNFWANWIPVAREPPVLGFLEPELYSLAGPASERVNNSH